MSFAFIGVAAVTMGLIVIGTLIHVPWAYALCLVGAVFAFLGGLAWIDRLDDGER